MESLFPQFPLRRIHRLDGLWQFSFVAECADPEHPDWNALAFDDLMAVPGVFDTLPPDAGRRGVGFYRTWITTNADRLRLKLNGLGLRATLFLDRKLIGIDDLPYTGICFDFPSGGPGKHELVIAVDNRLDYQRTPLFSQWYDYYGHGGIYRSVELHELAPCSFDRVEVRTLSLDGRVGVKLLLSGNVPEKLDFTCSFDDVAPQSMTAAVNDGALEFEARIANPALWSPESPRLHTVRLEADGEAIVERFGLRTIRAEKGRLLLNDAPLKLLGVCRHETHPQFGPALPLQLLREDVAFLRELHCNFVRGSHYQQDPRFLDLCDRFGILVWEEGIGWGDNETHLTDPGFRSGQLRQQKWIVANSFNHPSVILRGFLNEGDSESLPGRALYETLAAELRRLDPTRPITYASNHYERDINFDLVDVISLNAYPGWYAEDREAVRPLGEIAPVLDRFIAWMDQQGFGDKPFIVSEIGAGGIYGWRDRFRAHWSEEYQADYLDEVCRYILSHDRVTGVALWQYCDGRTYSSAYALGRPRAFNNKGLVDEYRRPKLAFETVRRHFSGEPAQGR